MLLPNIRDQWIRNRQDKSIFPCNTGELVLRLKSTAKKMSDATG